MIEISEKMAEAFEDSKTHGVDAAMSDLKHINELHASPHFRWFQKLISEEIRKLENRILIPRLVKDEEMSSERLKLVEWRKFSNLIYKKEQEARGVLEREDKKS